MLWGQGDLYQHLHCVVAGKRSKPDTWFKAAILSMSYQSLTEFWENPLLWKDHIQEGILYLDSTNLSPNEHMQ